MLYLHFHKVYGTQTYQGGDFEGQNPTQKSHDTSSTWSPDKLKALYFHFLKAYGSQT